MTYFAAIIFSLVVCAQCVASGAISGNITHLKCGREPNASVSLFPMIPMFQLLAWGIAWVLEQFTPNFALWILGSSFLALFVCWLMSYKRLKAEFERALRTVESNKKDGVIPQQH